ncbi:MAG: hypothetical protein M1822_006369 [Bathelium mastoideum]|nr:MAG: hypothetical protein M1822_006369 [Bathelium mastoideum]
MARPVTRRSSARLRKRSTTPKANSQLPGTFPDDDALAQEKSNLGSLPEAEEPEEGTATPAKVSKVPLKDPVDVQATPKQNTPIRPDPEEMHPGRHQSTTAKPLDEARWLGFMEKGAQTEPPKGGSKIPLITNTPTKVAKMPGTFSPPEFQFTFRHPSLELSPTAKQLMKETRAEAIKIRSLMTAEGSDLPTIEEQGQRKIAVPKGKAGRFSDVHMAEFKKMDSIANHPSSFRADPNRFQQIKASLKRSSSKADLDNTEPFSAKEPKHGKSQAGAGEAEGNSSVAKPIEFKVKTTGLEAASPMKRFKIHHENKAGGSRPVSRDGISYLPAVATTPTKSSLARSDSVKSVKTGIPSLARSPSKPTDVSASAKKAEIASLLARSPSKKLASSHSEPNTQSSSPPLLARSPSKRPTVTNTSNEEEGSSSIPLLSRSPSKKGPNQTTNTDKDEPRAPSTPLLSRSPSKKAIPSHQQHTDQSGQPSNIPLLSRTPAKFSVGENSAFKEAGKPTQTPVAPSSSLRNRFSALRGAGSAMKSILRSPQRLYSDDPFKIAAGTHVAVGTPLRNTEKTVSHKEPPSIPSVKKHVDFESSPAVEKRVIGSPSPVKVRPPVTDMMDVTYPSLPPRSPLAIGTSPSSPLKYPNLNQPDAQTALEEESKAISPPPAPATTPGAFTFRVGDPITFGPPAPSATDTAQSRTLMKPTIRRVRPSVAPSSFRRKSAAAETSTAMGKGKKRKLSETEGDEEKENKATTSETLSIFDIPDDDGDSEEARPAKKLRREPTPGEEGKGPKEKGGEKKVKTGSRLPKFGSAKGGSRTGSGKRTSGILSQARLNLLATPKHRRGA